MRKYLIYSFLLIFLLFSNSFGSERILSLREAINMALDKNHEIRAFRYSLDAQEEEIGIARSFLLPRVLFEERFMRTDNATYAFSSKLNQGRFGTQDFAIASLNNPEAINDFQTSISFEQPVYVRRANIGLNMAKKEFSAKDEDYARKKEEIVLKVIKAYIQVGTAGEYKKVAEKALEDAREHLRTADLRYKSGLGLFSDTLRASTALTGAEQMLVSSQKNLNVAKRALGLLLGMSESVDTLDEKIELSVKEIEHYTHESLSRSDIRSLELRYENARNNIKLAESGYFPLVGLGGSYQLNDHRKPFGAEGDSYQLMAFLKLELFDGTKREHERTKAKQQTLQTEENLSGLRNAVSFKVYEAYLGVQEARKNLELSRSALETAEEGQRLVKVRYENSFSPIVDLLDVQLILDNARTNLTARGNDLRIAIANLSYESGTILKDFK